MNSKTTQWDILSSGDNTRINDVNTMITPQEIIDQISLDLQTADFIRTSRIGISNIINLLDDRLLVITGPCSIHDTQEALEIAENLKVLQEKNPHLYIVMRTYFEKPRTTVGWKGLLSDPDLDGSNDIEKWLKVWRELLLKINKIWVPTAVEFLDTITPQYIADLIHWGAIWARTTESQEHRKLVSWLSMPVGFKNGTMGNIDIAIDAIWASKKSHSFLWATKDGRIAQLTTDWNPDGHVILRWWSETTNYDNDSVVETSQALSEKWIDAGILIDFSHQNSRKKHENQALVCTDVAKQIVAGNRKIVWVMIEANIHEGAQKHTPWTDNPANIKPGISITDACVNLETNEKMLRELNQAVEIRNTNI